MTSRWRASGCALLLADQSWVEIVAECQNGSEAVDADHAV